MNVTGNWKKTGHEELMKITFLVGEYENGGIQRWCLAIRDGRQEEHEQIIIVDPGPGAMEWMKEWIWIALKWETGHKGVWQMLRVPVGIRDWDLEDLGVWVCLIATTLAYILGGQQNFSLQNRALRISVARDIIIRKGQNAISNSIEHGMIKNPQETPFKLLRFDRANKKQGAEKQQGTKVKERASTTQQR